MSGIFAQQHLFRRRDAEVTEKKANFVVALRSLRLCGASSTRLLARYNSCFFRQSQAFAALDDNE
ncbi:hypothetical protein D6833_13595 [Candidatus Parcubacteria bacterium]|nr:MAG: hypothetical protein D6833_13595 [Candidatus Parcubacteria bacterium]